MAAPRVPARAGHRRDQGGEPAGHRLHPGRARHHRLGRHQRAGRGELVGDHPHRGKVPGRQRLRRTVRRRRARVRAAAGGRAAGEGRGARSRRSAGSRPRDRPQVGHYTDSDVVLEFLSREKLAAAGRAGHVLPGSFPADQGQAAGRGPAGVGDPWRTSWPGCASCTRPTARTTRATTTATPRRTPRRSGARTRRSCWSPGSGCSPSARTSRPPGSPASSTSTRST